jgi:hypothetical protein
MNDTTNIPAAACPRCGGWTAMGGCSQHSNAVTPVHGRTGCVCRGGNPPPTADLSEVSTEALRAEIFRRELAQQRLERAYWEGVLEANDADGVVTMTDLQ